MLKEAGIHTKYTAHSCRAASTLVSSKMGLDEKDIFQAGDCSNIKTFRSFYLRDIEPDNLAPAMDFSSSILSSR